MFPLLSFPFSPSEMFPLFHSFHSQFPWLLTFYISPYYITNIPSPILLLIIPSPRTLTLTFHVLIITLLHAQLWIRPSLSFPHRPTPSEGPCGASTLKRGHCHTCDSSPSAHPCRTHIGADYVIRI